MSNRNITISVTDEVYTSLIQEQNKSGLINHLVLEYYNKLQRKGNMPLSLAEIRAEKERISNLRTMEQKSVNMLTGQEQEFLEIQDKEKEKAKAKEKEVKKTYADYIHHLFIIEKEKAVEVVDNYYPNRENINIYDYCLEQGLIERSIPNEN